MLEKADRISLLIRKHLDNDLSVEEKVEFDAWLNESPKNRKLVASFTDDTLFDELLKEYARTSAIAENMELPGLEPPSPAISIKKTKPPVVAWAVAASALLVLGVYIYSLFDGRRLDGFSKVENQDASPQAVMTPATGSAVLILDGGAQIVLDSVPDGTIEAQGGKAIVKTPGQLIYVGEANEPVTHTLITAKGKMMNLVLPDGSLVSLNAGSSIRFPTEFTGDERPVEITGEAGFDIVKNERKPFRVTAQVPSGQTAEIEVLGTHFNINAYADENSIQTTLLEGKITIREPKTGVLRTLKPGQQARIDRGNRVQILNDVDTGAIVAWKNNYFHFNSDDLRTVMRQVSRWYDIEVKYAGDIPDKTFSGEINRSESLENVLKVLEQHDVKFDVKGKEVVVHHKL